MGAFVMQRLVCLQRHCCRQRAGAWQHLHQLGCIDGRINSMSAFQLAHELDQIAHAQSHDRDAPFLRHEMQP